MQKPVTHYSPSITSGSLPVQAAQASVFPSSFDSILFWDGNVPAVTTPHSIEGVKKTRNEYQQLVAIFLSAHDQITNVFSGGAPNIRDYLEKRIAAGIDSQELNALEAALKKKVIIVELLQRVTMHGSWHDAILHIGVDALSLDRETIAEFFASDVESERDDEVRLSFYEEFLLSLSAAYVKRILIEAVRILEDASATADAEIHRALARGEVAYTYRLPIGHGEEAGTVAGAIAIHFADGWTFGARIQGGIRLLAGLGEALISRATAVGIGALFYSPALANGERFPPIQRPAATVSRQTIHRPLSSVFQLFTWETVRQLRLPDLRKYRHTLELRCRHCLCSLKPYPRSSCLISGIAFTAFRLKAVYRQSTLFLIVLMKEQPQGENTAVDFSIPPKLEAQSSISIGQVLP
jgi:hypothetical protein